VGGTGWKRWTAEKVVPETEAGVRPEFAKEAGERTAGQLATLVAGFSDPPSIFKRFGLPSTSQMR
jgi:hypothetical protein